MLKRIDSKHPDFAAVESLYEEAFPADERPSTIREMLARTSELKEGLTVRLLGIYPDEAPDDFSGFFLTIWVEAAVYLYFFAISSQKRSRGLGARAMSALTASCGTRQLVFDYESVYEECDNLEQRERRRAFYLRNGFYETGWFYRCDGIEYMVACSKEAFDRNAFESFLVATTTLMRDGGSSGLYRRG